ncbi:MAG: hypothetical protein N2Z65_07600 [Clostridiales bacterium]|nr:hypothetical protein [Clostridiales bacterium]
MKKYLIFIIVIAACILPQIGCTKENTSKNTDATVNANVPDTIPSEKTSSEMVTVSRSTDSEGKFTPISKDQDYGMILYQTSALPLDNKGSKATLELFVKAEQANGKIAWDDGQNWYLIVRDGKSVFLLLDNVYVQGGKINYWPIWSYDKNAPGLLVMVQESAGIHEYSYTYDRVKDCFYKQDIYKTEGNIAILSSEKNISGNDK